MRFSRPNTFVCFLSGLGAAACLNQANKRHLEPMYRVTDCSGLGGASGGCLVQPSWVLNISSDGDCEPLWVILCFLTTIRFKKRVFLMFKQNFLYFRLCSLFLVLSQSTTEKSVVQLSLHSLIRYLYTLISSPLSLLVFRLSCFSSCAACSGPCSCLYALLLYIRAPSVLGNPELGPVLQLTHRCWAGGRVTSLGMLEMVLSADTGRLLSPCPRKGKSPCWINFYFIFLTCVRKDGLLALMAMFQ